MNRRRRVSPTKSKIRTNTSLRRRTTKKHNASAITARNNVYRLSIVKEVEIENAVEAETATAL